MGPPRLQVAEKEWTRADMPSSSFVIEDSSPSPTSEASTSGSGPYIEHTVTRLDTLAGVAIKYGVEVADVKRLNGLTTDLQMFALKTLRIPTPGRHPPGSRYENLTSTSHLHSAGNHDLGFASSRNHKASQETTHEETSTMALLRDYYGLPSTSAKDGIEMATISLDKETDLDDAAFLPMHRPPNSTNPRRHSVGDYRTNRCGYTRESCNDLLGSCWSVKASEETSLLMKPSKQVLREGDLPSKERPIRRRTRDDTLVDVNFPRSNDPAPRLKDSEGAVGSSGMKTFGAALLGKKEAVEGLLSKLTATSAASQESGRPVSERVPSSTGSFSLFEGITSVYRQAKAALD